MASNIWRTATTLSRPEGSRSVSQLGRRSGDEVMWKGYGMVFPEGSSSTNLVVHSAHRNTMKMAVGEHGGRAHGDWGHGGRR